ncbi:MAG: hypothetical protein HC845_03495 [Akkermansiaceae bacterium]|nr:hypothetical protein [Akkermansiaceae bacterium]
MNINILSKIDFVSFDIFDTLVHRRLAAPVDIFYATRNKLCKNREALFYGKEISEFGSMRILAEKKAREHRIKKFGGEGEVTFDEIYQTYQNMTSCDLAFLELLKKTELELELNFLYKSTQGYALYKQAKESGKKIIYISDMYLPPSFIEEMMQQVGYKDCNSKSLFVSGSVRKSKHSGELYKYVSNHLNIDFKKWLHIGDNLKSDVENAKKFGIITHHANWAKISNLPQNISGMNDYIVDSVIKTTSQSHYVYNSRNDEFHEQGYNIFGPLMFGFYLWFLNEVKQFKADKILFFARDAQIIMKIHELALKTTGFTVPYEYVFASRNSLYHIGLSEISLNKLFHYTSGKSPKTVASIMQMLGICADDHLQVLNAHKLKPDTILSSSNKAKMRQVLSKIYDYLLKSGNSQRDLYQQYFTQMIADASNIAIVDIGWVGNIQNCFLRTIGDSWSEKQFKGLYLGLLNGCKENISFYSQMQGYLIDKGIPEKHETLLTNGGIEILEFALTANHGSTLGYENNEIGKIVPILEEKTAQEILYEEKAMMLQAGILDFVNDHLHLIRIFPIESLISNIWCKKFLKLVENPSHKQIETFADLSHSDSAGKNSLRLPLAPKLPFWKCLVSKSFYSENEKLAFWKSAYRKRNSRKILSGDYLNKYI